ncbi:response regulator [Saccharothrix coeruleofusca]|uniref:DNA-binding response regulator n=1 Tax=Saccharothrix coeruleofusca TaxID=33919 RepID=A0A918AT99_9PSEU|nr:response regulator transcription factor [Saccharothrix coeruleofusca]MBP2334656.1 DNA-binding NarL/FixJ family response regulator [Saccharothrix coeruleofusca]GGP72962.1 DNA-binding response regulator [Saccharothrix coeruleofusca]
MIRVVLADDEPVVRVGVRAVLAAAGDVEVVAEAEDGRTAVDLVLAHRPQVAVLDIRMPVLTGLEAAAELRRRDTGTAVMLLTTFADDANIARALGAGASGFVLKTGDPHEIIAGVRAVATGAAYLSPLVAKRVVDHLSGTGPRLRENDRVAGLTDREREVLGLLGAGLSNAEIAAYLHVAEGTVKIYVSTVIKRLGVRNRVQAAVVAHQAGLIPDTTC